MAKMLRCRDIGVDCGGVIRAKTEAELMKKVAEHAKKVHGMSKIPPELAAKVKKAIRDV